MAGMRIVLKGRGVAPGRAEGVAAVSRRPFMFAHGIDPKTGEVVDVRSDITGQDISGKVLVFPGGKGSTTGSAWLLEAARLGNAPAAVVTGEAEPVIATAVVLARLVYGVSIPLVDRLQQAPLDSVPEGARVRVDGGTGEITVLD